MILLIFLQINSYFPPNNAQLQSTFCVCQNSYQINCSELCGQYKRIDFQSKSISYCLKNYSQELINFLIAGTIPNLPEMIPKFNLNDFNHTSAIFYSVGKRIPHSIHNNTSLFDNKEHIILYNGTAGNQTNILFTNLNIHFESGKYNFNNLHLYNTDFTPYEKNSTVVSLHQRYLTGDYRSISQIPEKINHYGPTKGAEIECDKNITNIQFFTNLSIIFSGKSNQVKPFLIDLSQVGQKYNTTITINSRELNITFDKVPNNEFEIPKIVFKMQVNSKIYINADQFENDKIPINRITFVHQSKTLYLYSKNGTTPPTFSYIGNGYRYLNDQKRIFHNSYCLCQKLDCEEKCGKNTKIINDFDSISLDKTVVGNPSESLTYYIANSRETEGNYPVFDLEHFGDRKLRFIGATSDEHIGFVGDATDDIGEFSFSEVTMHTKNGENTLLFPNVSFHRVKIYQLQLTRRSQYEEKEPSQSSKPSSSKDEGKKEASKSESTEKSDKNDSSKENDKSDSDGDHRKSDSNKESRKSESDGKSDKNDSSKENNSKNDSDEDHRKSGSARKSYVSGSNKESRKSESTEKSDKNDSSKENGSKNDSDEDHRKSDSNKESRKSESDGKSDKNDSSKENSSKNDSDDDHRKSGSARKSYVSGSNKESRKSESTEKSDKNDSSKENSSKNDSDDDHRKSGSARKSYVSGSGKRSIKSGKITKNDSSKESSRSELISESGSDKESGKSYSFSFTISKQYFLRSTYLIIDYSTLKNFVANNVVIAAPQNGAEVHTASIESDLNFHFFTSNQVELNELVNFSLMPHTTLTVYTTKNVNFLISEHFPRVVSSFPKIRLVLEGDESTISFPEPSGWPAKLSDISAKVTVVHGSNTVYLAGHFNSEKKEYETKPPIVDHEGSGPFFLNGLLSNFKSEYCVCNGSLCFEQCQNSQKNDDEKERSLWPAIGFTEGEIEKTVIGNPTKSIDYFIHGSRPNNRPLFGLHTFKSKSFTIVGCDDDEENFRHEAEGIYQYVALEGAHAMEEIVSTSVSHKFKNVDILLSNAGIYFFNNVVFENCVIGRNESVSITPKDGFTKYFSIIHSGMTIDMKTLHSFTSVKADELMVPTTTYLDVNGGDDLAKITVDDMYHLTLTNQNDELTSHIDVSLLKRNPPALKTSFGSDENHPVLVIMKKNIEIKEVGDVPRFIIDVSNMKTEDAYISFTGQKWIGGFANLSSRISIRHGYVNVHLISEKVVNEKKKNEYKKIIPPIIKFDGTGDIYIDGNKQLSGISYLNGNIIIANKNEYEKKVEEEKKGKLYYSMIIAICLIIFVVLYCIVSWFLKKRKLESYGQMRKPAHLSKHYFENDMTDLPKEQFKEVDDQSI